MVKMEAVPTAQPLGGACGAPVRHQVEQCVAMVDGRIVQFKCTQLVGYGAKYLVIFRSTSHVPIIYS